MQRNAIAGRARLLRLLRALPRTFDESNFIDLLQRGCARSDFVQSRLAQEPHSFFASGPPDFRGRLLSQNHFPDAVAQVEQFVNGGTPAKSCTCALNTALAFVK